MKRALWAALISLGLLLAAGCGKSEDFPSDYKTNANSNPDNEKENMKNQNPPSTLKR